MNDDEPAATTAGIRRARGRGDATREVGPGRRARGLLAVGGTVLSAVALVGSCGTAFAEEASETPLAITSYADGQFVSGDRLALEGIAPEGRVTVTTAGADPCASDVVDGTWSCAMTVPDGAVSLTATLTPAPSSDPDAASPEPTPSATTSTVRITLHVLGAPTVTPDDPVGTVVRGSGYPGAIVVLSTAAESADRAGAAAETTCATVASDGSWSCRIDIPTGAYLVSARQHVPGHPEQSSPPSPARATRVDRDPPPAPTITSPRPGARVSTEQDVSGTGEDGGSVSVFVDGSLSCSAIVAQGAWTCRVRLDHGTVRLTAIQRDAVGNYSSPAQPVAVTVPGAPAPAPDPDPTTPDPDPTPAPQSPPRSEDPQGGSPNAGGPTEDGSTTTDGWSHPTGFGGALPAVTTAFQGPAVLAGIAAALVFVALIALPLRLARSALGPRIRLPRVFGRNRRIVADEGSGSPVRSLGAMAVGWVGVVIAAAALAGTPEYVRLVTAVVAGLVLLNLVAVVLVGGIVARILGGGRSLRPVPILLALGVAAVVVSSIAGLDPPLIIGILVASSIDRRGRAGVIAQLVQLAAIEAVALAAWAGHGLVGGVGLWGVGLHEALAAVAISGLCSAVALLIPLGSLPGRALFEHSRAAWGGAATVAAGLAAIALGHGSALLAGFVLSGIVAAGCLAVWAWVRWVEPALGDRA